jgi:hypothetical protein
MEEEGPDTELEDISSNLLSASRLSVYNLLSLRNNSHFQPYFNKDRCFPKLLPKF